jgi:magnesium transporter
MEESSRIILETVNDMLARGSLSQAVTTIGGLHSADAADILSNLEIDREAEILVNMEPRAAARALLEMEEEHQVEVSSRLRTGQLHDLLESMPVDEAVDLLGDIPEDKRLVLLRLFGREQAGELEELLTYSDKSAGGLMTPDFVSVPPSATAEEVIDKLRSVDPEVETIYYVYVVSDYGPLEGVLSLRDLIISPPGRLVEQMISGDVISVRPNDDQEKVAEVISKYDLLAVPVTDDEGDMLGIVTVDDVMDVIGDEAEEDLAKFAGATGIEEESPGGLLANLGRRLPWFFAAVIVEILVAGGLLKLYSPVLQKFIVLIFFIPLLVTMGGNIAVQSSTIMSRWLATGKPLKRETLKEVYEEVGWGLLVGILAGGAVAGLSFLFHLGPSIGLVVGLSLGLTVLAASIVGCAMPITLKALDRDPGSVSGPLIGTTMDVLSLAIYLGIARLLI